MYKLSVLVLAGLTVGLAADAKSAFKGLNYSDGVLKYNTAICAAKAKAKKCSSIRCKRELEGLVKIVLKDFVKTYGTFPPESADSCSGWV
jgi:hypothetical protein